MLVGTGDRKPDDAAKDKDNTEAGASITGWLDEIVVEIAPTATLEADDVLVNSLAISVTLISLTISLAEADTSETKVSTVKDNNTKF